jgi:menaquinol-cytochrome c reductase cytochrome b subunit
VVGINLNGTVPILGPFLADFLQGGAQIGPDTLPRWYALHMLLIPGALIFLILFHLYLVVRLGVSSPPWSKEAADMIPVDDERPARAGLVAPAPRGVVRR